MKVGPKNNWVFFVRDLFRPATLHRFSCLKWLSNTQRTIRGVDTHIDDMPRLKKASTGNREYFTTFFILSMDPWTSAGEEKDLEVTEETGAPFTSLERNTEVSRTVAMTEVKCMKIIVLFCWMVERSGGPM